MDAITALQERRSIRKYRQEKVDRKLMTEIIDITRWAPSWANYQIARWTLVDDQALIDRLMADGVKGFAYNIKTLKNAKGVAWNCLPDLLPCCPCQRRRHLHYGRYQQYCNRSDRGSSRG